MYQNQRSTLKLTQLAILVAILLLFAFTPFGYIKMPGVEITLLCLPVAIGAITLGPSAGAILGAVFGITSFIQCFGMSAFGTLLFSINPLFTFLMCFIPRLLCGWLSGLLFKVLYKFDKTKLVSYFAASLSTALLNTLFFVLAIRLLFWNEPVFLSAMADANISTESIGIFMVGFVTINGIIEAIVNLVVGGTLTKVIAKLLKTA